MARPRGPLACARLVLDYLKHHKPLWDEGSYCRVATALGAVVRLYAVEPAEDFGPVRLAVVRDQLVRAGYARTYVNRMVGDVRRCWKWAVSREMLGAERLAALQTLEPLERGRTAAPETPKIPPADLADVEKTIPNLPPTIGDMVRVQLLTGMRPGEVCALRPVDVDRGWKVVGEVSVWLYRLDQHKNDWRGAPRWIPIGPQAQAIIVPYLTSRSRKPDDYCFRPCDVAREWMESRGREYNPGGSRRPGVKYRTTAYDAVVRRGCDRAGVARWSPNQLRHRAATDAEVEGGREDSRALLGHKNPSVTAVYVEIAERGAVVAARRG